MARYFRAVAKGFLGLLLLGAGCAAVFYFYFLTPQVRAAKHLDFIHQSITEIHPAVLDSSATQFHAWYITAHENAAALLPLVHSAADERALLNYYLVGYRDSHVAGDLAYSIYSYSLFEQSTERWTGWLLTANATGYEVVYSLGGDLYPEIGMQLISCDNRLIYELLQNRYAPYLDMRWNLLVARDRAAKALTQKSASYELLERPDISLCLFKSGAGEERQFPLVWQTLDEKSKQRVNTLNFKKYSYPSLTLKGNNLAWVNVSDFKLETPIAYEHHQQLLKDLISLQGNETLVFDLRLNSGGNSGFGNEILTAVFGKSGMAYLET